MNNKVKKTILTSLVLQVITIICGFILPKLILEAFGSTYNGIINSVNQFLGCVTLLRAGIGGVTRAALYKPLIEHDNEKISEIIKATEIFMRKIAGIFIILLIGFATIYPIFVKEEFSWGFSFSLVLILGISTIFQYYFGITYQILLHADQKLYVYNILQIGGVILNTIVAVILIKLNFEIRIVKLASALVYCLTPLLMYRYIHKNYSINKKVKADNTTINQRWDAFAHQIAAFVHSNTDIMVLTIFADLYQVSIYSIYNMVVFGVKQLIFTCSNAIESMFGNIIASNNEDKLKKELYSYEWSINVISSILLICTAILLVPFVMIYTKGVIDTNYKQPLFAYLLCFATFLSCVRLPYQNTVEAAGHFRQTKNGAIAEASINILISIILVIRFGCIGVAIGTIIAVGFRTIQYANYTSKYIVKRSKNIYLKRLLVSSISIIAIMIPYFLMNLEKLLLTATNFSTWFIYAILTFIIVSIGVIIINWLFYPDITAIYIKLIIKKISKHKQIYKKVVKLDI